MYEEAIKIIAAFLVVAVVATLETGTVIVLLPCLLAAWAVWQLAAGLSGRR